MANSTHVSHCLSFLNLAFICWLLQEGEFWFVGSSKSSLRLTLMKYLAELFMPHKKKQVFISNIFSLFPLRLQNSQYILLTCTQNDFSYKETFWSCCINFFLENCQLDHQWWHVKGKYYSRAFKLHKEHFYLH